MARLLRNCSRMMRGRRGIERRARRAASASVVRVALVDLVHRQAEAAAAAGGRSAARARGVVVRRAVGVERHADHQRVGLPFARSARRSRRSARRPRPRWWPAAWRCVSRRLPLATPVRFGAEIEGQETLEMGRDGGGRGSAVGHRQSAHACPASGDSMPGLEAQQRQRLVVALLDRRVEDHAGLGADGEPAVVGQSRLRAGPRPSRCSRASPAPCAGRRRWPALPARPCWWSSRARRGSSWSRRRRLVGFVALGEHRLVQHEAALGLHRAA